jgi:hypothetical protein
MMCTVTTNQMCTAIRTITLDNPFKEPKRKKDKSLTIIAVASQEEKQGQTSQLEPITSDFESWWRLYPRRVGKLKAEQAYTSVITRKKVTPDDLLEGAIRYAAERSGQDPKYTRHPTTWLNAGGWLDEPQQPSRPTGLAAIRAGLESFYYDEVRK